MRRRVDTFPVEDRVREERPEPGETVEATEMVQIRGDRDGNEQECRVQAGTGIKNRPEEH